MSQKIKNVRQAENIIAKYDPKFIEDWKLNAWAISGLQKELYAEALLQKQEKSIGSCVLRCMLHEKCKQCQGDIYEDEKTN